MHEIQSIYRASTIRFVFNCCHKGCESRMVSFLSQTYSLSIFFFICVPSFILCPSFSLPLYELVVITLANICFGTAAGARGTHITSDTHTQTDNASHFQHFQKRLCPVWKTDFKTSGTPGFYLFYLIYLGLWLFFNGFLCKTQKLMLYSYKVV